MENLKNIQISFLSGIPVNRIEFGEIFNNLNWEDQEQFAEATILHERNIRYPLRKDYQIAFIKHVIKQLEDHGAEEIHDKLYESLSSQMEAENQDFSYKHYKIDEIHFVTIKEANSFIRDGTTGLKVWEASIALSNFIIHQRNFFQGKSILELGSGCGALVGLVLLKLCNCRQVILSDCHESVLSQMQENLRLNLTEVENLKKLDSSLLVKEHLKMEDRVDLAVLNIPWENVDEIKEELSTICRPDVILGADIIYDSSIFGSLIQCLNALFEVFNNQKLSFILSQTIRNDETFEEFREILKRSNFSIEEISQSNTPATFHYFTDASRIKIFRILKR